MGKPIFIAILLATPVALTLDNSFHSTNRHVCDNGLVYCGSISCIPAGTNCCIDGSYCPVLKYCTVGSNGQTICCPNGQLCEGQGGPSPTFIPGCKPGQVVCAGKGCMPIGDTCCSDGTLCLAQEYCTVRENSIIACCSSGVSCTENGGTSFSPSTEAVTTQNTVPLTTSVASLPNTEPSSYPGISHLSMTGNPTVANPSTAGTRSLSVIMSSATGSPGNFKSSVPTGSTAAATLAPKGSATTTASRSTAEISRHFASWIFILAPMALVNVLDLGFRQNMA